MCGVGFCAPWPWRSPGIGRAQHRGLCERARAHIVVNMDGLLGEFELMVMLAVVRLGDDAFAVPVRQLIQDEADRRVARGALYTTLERLERKGLLTSRLGDPLPERGGRARRYFQPTASGLESVERSRRALMNLWRGVGRLGEEG